MPKTLEEVTARRDARAAASSNASNPNGDYFVVSLDYVLAELECIRLRLQIQMSRMQERSSLGSEFKGLVVSEKEVEALIDRPLGVLPAVENSSRPGSEEIIRLLSERSEKVAAQRAESLRRGTKLRLHELQAAFGLSRFDVECLLICLAAELDLRYERLYAYLQDDVTKTRPTADLVLNLLCPTFAEKLVQRERFAPNAPLVARQILLLSDDPSQPASTLLAKRLRLDERITRHLLDSDEIDFRICAYAMCVRPQKSIEDLVLPPDIKRTLNSLSKQASAPGRILLYMQGPYGCGRKATAEALCRDWGLRLLVVDLDGLIGSQPTTPAVALELVLREAVLRGDALYLEEFDSLLAEDKVAIRKAFCNQLRGHSGVVFLAGESYWQPRDEIADFSFVHIEFPVPDYVSRYELWSRSLEANGNSALDISTVANKFRFTGGQIKDSLRTVQRHARWQGAQSAQVGLTDLIDACRLQSNRKLSKLGRKVTPRQSWDDIVLPVDRLQQLREICNAMKHRSKVLEEWGFDRKLSLGKGLNILFAGPSGTGKTMAAEIMAAELELDLYKIDLSTVVSKYIGETEKNLARIFAEAECSNAILFFDEADALFGKRSEVRDSHDRYANIEINYLLQKMEEHEGVVILATNFRRNMDDAFVRRMHFTVEFPLPSEADRRRIWEQIWPKDTPHAADLDFEFMARRFEIPGGNIRNIAMAAAFLAASDGGVVNMSHLLHGTRREYQKMGKVVMQGEFQ